MAQVVITYNAWDANRGPVPAINEPEVWFRPIATSVAVGLITDREVRGSLDVATGAGSVSLESAPGLFYVPILRWLKNPQDPANRARGSAEWDPFHPGQGGDISALQPLVGFSGLLFGFGPPPEDLEDAVYLDITGPAVGIWGPSGGNI